MSTFTFVSDDKKVEFPVKYKVVTDETVLFCKNIQPSPMRKGLKLIGVVELDLKNVTNKYKFTDSIIFSNYRLEITDVITDRVFDKKYY